MPHTPHAKIVATLGPASASEQVIEELYERGVDVFRLNFSHGTHEDHKASFDIIRKLERKVERPIGVLMDLQGPKLRISNFKDGSIQLKPGDTFRLDSDSSKGDTSRIYLPHPEIFHVISKSMSLLLDDGKIHLKVLHHAKDYIDTQVIVGGTLSNHKGVNIPDVKLPISALTEKDKKDLAYGLKLGVDWVALSFVQRPKDILEAQKLIKGNAGLISKLQKPSAIEHLNEIVELSDAIMVARGDLGVEMPPEEVPIIQKRIIKACRKAGKPVIIATQMLDSMIHSPTPTRAEASDVATAIYDGVDAVMLSAESASGHFPVETVDMMDRIIRRVEEDPLYRKLLEVSRPDPQETVEDAITAAARKVAQTLPISAIVAFTETGATPCREARERPESHILALTPKLETARRLSLVWGIYPIVIEREIERTKQMVETACFHALHKKFANKGDLLVITAGIPLRTPGTSNFLRIVKVQ
ncbi:MAG: pyruvate kinase [Alphaproteobacteria bacterium]|nr:pyruvate kinase [Alphaproteobacteria bacterium]